MKKKGRRGDYFFERSLLRLISFWSSRSPPLLGHEERDKGAEGLLSSLRKKPPTAQTSFFFGKKRKAHTHKKEKTQKKVFLLHSILALHQRGSFQNKHKTHTNEKKKERKRRDKSAAATTTTKTTTRR